MNVSCNILVGLALYRELIIVTGVKTGMHFQHIHHYLTKMRKGNKGSDKKNQTYISIPLSLTLDQFAFVHAL